MSEKSSEKSEMSEVAEASWLVRDIVGADAGDSISARILTAARKLGWSYSRTKDVWYQDARIIKAGEMDRLRALKRERQIKEASHEFQELSVRIERMEEAFAAWSAAMAVRPVAGEEQAVPRMGRVDLAGGDGR